MIQGYDSYRKYLQMVCSERKANNPAYSMSAFAQQIGISQSSISQILAGRRNLSVERAYKVAKKLNLNDNDSDYFCLLVQLENSKSQSFKETVLAKLSALSGDRKVEVLSIEHFRVISEWYHLVIRNMVNLGGGLLDPRAISKRLGISALEVSTAIERLCRLELIEAVPNKPDYYRKTKQSLLVGSIAPNEAIRKFHKQMLAKAIESLETQTSKEKIIGSETFAFNTDDLAEADRLTEEYFRQMAALADKPGVKNEVYHLGVQFFNTTKRSSNEKV